MKKLFKSKKYQSKYSNYYKKTKDINETIEKRYNILIAIITILLFILFFRLFFIQIIKEKQYKEKLEEATKLTVQGSTAPRGRIYDRNHKLIVDNKPIKVIYYQKPSKVTVEEEIKIAYKLAELIELDYSSLKENNLKDFWIMNNYKKSQKLIKDEEWQQYEERKINDEDIFQLKLKRIDNNILKKYNEKDKKSAFIYNLMNKGYSYNEKVIKKENITDQEYALVAENLSKLSGVGVKLDWEREYLYNDVFKNILGNVSSSEMGIPYEHKDYYLELGYSLNDRVGISYLEYQYENYLKGEKNVYEKNSSNEMKLVKNGKKGNDIVLTIDIELQKSVEEILKKQLLETKKEANTEYYNRSFVVITEPNTGEILAMSGKQIVQTNGEYKIYDYTPGIVSSPVVIGSSVKGASNIVAYNNGVLQIGEYKNDKCIKIASTKEKCSWRYLGNINDIDALKFSSNVYQYDSAIKIGKGTYIYDKPLKIDTKAFDIYREGFAEFGLGVKTEIDLPIESLGYKGNSTLTGHLLDFSIGQYDSYTPIQLSQYITTIANNGTRYKMNLLKEVYEGTSDLSKLVYKYEPEILNKVNTQPKFMDRVKEGFISVMNPSGTGYGYIDLSLKPAGKTGTSESFIDTNDDGIVDTETLTNTFVSYFPYDNPKYTLTVISPDIYHYGNNSNFKTTVNKRIAYEVSKKIFDFYQ